MKDRRLAGSVFAVDEKILAAERYRYRIWPGEGAKIANLKCLDFERGGGRYSRSARRCCAIGRRTTDVECHVRHSRPSIIRTASKVWRSESMVRNRALGMRCLAAKASAALTSATPSRPASL